MKIATNITIDPPLAKSACVDDTQIIVFIDGTRADRAQRQVIANIECCETQRDVDTYLESETPLIEAIRKYNDLWADEIHDFAADHKLILAP